MKDQLLKIKSALLEQIAEIDLLVKSFPDTFLDELSAPIAVVSDEPEPAPGTPEMEGIEIPEKEPELPFLKRGSEGWNALIKHLMTRDVPELPKVGKKFQLTDKDWQYLKDLIYYKSELFAGNMTLEQITAQGIDDNEKGWFVRISETIKSLA